MFCRNCGKEINPQAVICVACGAGLNSGKRFCQYCGGETNPLAEICTKCGVRLALPIYEQADKSKIAAGLLGIFLGGLGIHRFYLGYTNIAVAQLILGLLGIVTCGITSVASCIWGLVDGIMILTGSLNRDAQGRPLKD
ncbi:MAG: TM2 domain-containing protein [Ignavibacteriae bacterium]|nr:TM2 domain-containing protein [Ignavibacteriota bacterium]